MTRPAIVRLIDAGVVHRHGRHEVTALHPTRLQLRAGECVAITGRSGAGKTTLAELMLGLRRPTVGTVMLGERVWVDRRRGPSRAARRLVQGVPQDAGASLVPSMTIYQS